jgi:endonuclease YncB( thermonuclease family)
VGTVVRLEADEVGVDAEGNLLRYMWIDRNDEQVLVNRELIAEGYAAFAPDADNGRYDEELAEAERSAIAGEKRIWSDCGRPHQPIAGAEPAASPATAAISRIRATVGRNR